MVVNKMQPARLVRICLKRVLIPLLALTVIPILTLFASADDSNTTSGSGDRNRAYRAYYRTSEYGWRVSVYVGKGIGYTEEEYKAMSLEGGFIRLGTADFIRSGMTVAADTVSGSGNKPDYIISRSFSSSAVGSYYESDCPAPPVVCSGSTATVKSYFLRNTVVLDIADTLARENGFADAGEYLQSLDYYIREETEEGTVRRRVSGSSLAAELLLPAGARKNYIPWVIIYEPLVYIYLDGGGHALLTATEVALAQGSEWNWHTVGSDASAVYTWNGNVYETGNLYAQCIQSMAFGSLPSSVMTEEEWFGYPTSTDRAYWDCGDILSYGGWGMGYLSASDLTEEEKDDITKEEIIEEDDDGEEDDGEEPEPELDLAVHAVTPDGPYTAGSRVITSFRVRNYTYTQDVYPGDGIYVRVTVSGAGTGLAADENIPVRALPGGEETLVWFDWEVPDTPGVTLSWTAEVLGSDIADNDMSDNFCSGHFTVSDRFESHTPGISYRAAAPADFEVPDTLTSADDGNSWSVWEYDGGFEYVTYTASLSGVCKITPDADSPSASRLATGWQVRSGYGFTLEAEAGTDVTNGGAGDVIMPQSCLVLFPEYGYSEEQGKCETAAGGAGAFTFRENDGAGGKPVHYMPLWYPDGDEGYSVCAVFGGGWTPGGYLSCTCCSNAFDVKGSLFDDWCVER